MAELSYFFNGTTTGDAGPYSDSEFGLYTAAQATGNTFGHYDGALVNEWNAGGVIYGSGLWDDNSSQKASTLNAYFNGIPVNAGGAGNLFVFLRYPSGATYDIGVSTGAMLCSTSSGTRFGVLYYNSTVFTVSLAANGTANSRIDVIYVDVDTTAQTARIAVLQGTPSASPVVPDGAVNVLAYVTVPPGGMTAQTNIRQAGSAVNAPQCVIVPNVINNSGQTLQTGDVVSWVTSATTNIEGGSGGADRRVYAAAVTLCGANDTNVAGIWLGRATDWTAIGSTAQTVGAVLTQGIAFVRISSMPSAAQNGGVLTTAATGLAAVAAAGERVQLGRILQTGASGRLASYGFCLCAVDIQNLAPAAGVATLAADRSTSSASFADMTDMSITITTTGGRVLLGFTAPFSNSATSLNNFTFAVDGVDVGNATRGLTSITIVTATQSGNPAMTYLTPTALSAGSHTFKVRWKTNAGTATAYQDGQFWAQEVV